MRARGRAGWAALFAAISLTCGRSSNQGGPQGKAASGVEVSIDPAAVAIMGGGTIRFTAAVAGTAGAWVIMSNDGGTPSPAVPDNLTLAPGTSLGAIMRAA